MNTGKEGKEFCKNTIKPWLWVLAVLIGLTIVWAIWGGKRNFAWRGDANEPEAEAGRSNMTTSARAQHVLMPLPLGAARTVTPPHEPRGRCYNCHPVARTGTPPPTGTGTLPPRGGMWQQANGTRPAGTAFDIQEAFAEAAAIVKPAVVNISITRGSKKQNPLVMRFANPFGELLNAPNPPSTIPQQAATQQTPQTAPQITPEQQVQQPLISSGIGSGTIVDERGYILTNYHVIAGATSITVLVPGSKGVKYMGQVVRTDVETDLALIKLLADAEFPTAILGNSDTIQVGDFVLAIGSPFGLEQTVTSGIISDTNRTLDIEGRTYVALMQTDAFINRGNSGGPLVNIDGEVIGINTAIYSPTEGFTGIGFAIPINHARQLLRGVVEGPEVARARAALAAQMAQFMAAGPEASWLGIDVQTVDEVIGEQFKVPGKKGVLVNNVLENSPASVAGIQRGDVIIICDNKRLKDVTQLRDILLDKKVGDKISIQLVRNGKRKRLNVVLAARPDNLPTAPPPKNEVEAEWRGMDITSLTPAIRRELRIPKTVTGATVVVEVEGAAALAGVQPGDVIKSINSQPIETPSDLFLAIDKIDPSQGVVLDISRNGIPMYITIN